MEPADTVVVVAVVVDVVVQAEVYIRYLWAVHHPEDAIEDSQQGEPAPIVVDDIVHAVCLIEAKEGPADLNPDNNAVVQSVGTYHSPDYNVAPVPVHIALGQYTQYSYSRRRERKHLH